MTSEQYDIGFDDPFVVLAVLVLFCLATFTIIEFIDAHLCSVRINLRACIDKVRIGP